MLSYVWHSLLNDKVDLLTLIDMSECRNKKSGSLLASNTMNCNKNYETIIHIENNLNIYKKKY